MHELKSVVRFSEVDTHTRLRLDALIDYFQDVAVAESQAHYGGLTYLSAMDLGWVVNFWQIDIDRLPQLGEQISAITFPFSYRHFLGLRNNLMKTADGEILIRSWSVWSMVNLKEGKLARLPQKVIDLDPVDPKLDMEYTDRKIDLPDLAGQAQPPVQVTPIMLDENGHLNNAWFVRMALDLLPHDRNPRRLRVEYRKQAFLGDRITPVLYPIPADNQSLVALNDDQGQPCCLVELTTD